jgi:DNA-binding transcriptional ArsR family regulator
MSTGRLSAGARRQRLERPEYPEYPEITAPVFAALGDETRLRLVARLSSGGPQSISRLSAGADVTRQAVTKHLQVLADAGLARSARLGRESIWELQPEKLEEARRALDRISAQWDEALGRLKAFVER